MRAPAARRGGAPADCEAALAERWGAGLRGRLRLEDGRVLRVVFPGVPGGGAGPDFRGAILDAGGDLLRGDVEIHVRASGWRAHGHHLDEAYAAVALHVVGENDTGAAATLHRGGRAIAVLVLRQGRAEFPPPFAPPCTLASARGHDPGPALERLGIRRLQMKAARAAPLVASAGTGQALYTLLLETLAGPANRAAFAALARRLPLGVLLERCGEGGCEPGSPARSRRIGAELRGCAAGLALRRAGLRPLAEPGRRLDAAAAIVARLWREGPGPSWPGSLDPGALPGAMRVAGTGRSTAIELAVNAVLPVALAGGAWTEKECREAFLSLPSPGTYGKLRRLEGWLGAGGVRPFNSAARLQGGLLLQADYCTKGMCGRCPIEG